MKTKTMKRLAAAVAAITMMSAVPMMSMPGIVNASSITINKTENEEHDYKAYQIFSGNASTGDVLSNITWGSSVKKIDAGGNVLYDHSGNIITALGLANGATIEQVINKIKITDVQTVSKNIYSVLEGKTVDAETFKSAVTKTVSDGYYLIVDASSAYSALSANFLQVAGDVSINPKFTKPTLDKQIVTGPNANDRAEYNTATIGEAIKYELSSKVPDMTGYNKYFFVVNDTFASGLDFWYDSNHPVEVIIKGAGTNGADLSLTDVSAETDKYTKAGHVFYTDVNGKNLKIVLSDFIQYNTQDYAGKDIVITYYGKLNNNASLATTKNDASANVNTVNLTYSNNPNFNYVGDNGDNNSDNSTTNKPNEPDPGMPGTPNDSTDPKEPVSNTPPEDVITYTASLQILKVDGADNSKNLQGAKFEVYKDSACKTEDKVFDERISDVNGIINFSGIGEGTYWLKETLAPTGYNLLSAPVKLVVSKNASSSKNEIFWISESPVTVGNDDSNNASRYNVTIGNNKGTTLPSTGGIGTTIFYVSGGALILGAGVVLITKKRMSAKEDR